MSTCRINIAPLPAWCREYPDRYWPLSPPIFQGGAPTPEDWALARELFEALDPESQRWHTQGWTPPWLREEPSA